MVQWSRAQGLTDLGQTSRGAERVRPGRGVRPRNTCWLSGRPVPPAPAPCRSPTGLPLLWPLRRPGNMGAGVPGRPVQSRRVEGEWDQDDPPSTPPRFPYTPQATSRSAFTSPIEPAKKRRPLQLTPNRRILETGGEAAGSRSVVHGCRRVFPAGDLRGRVRVHVLAVDGARRARIRAPSPTPGGEGARTPGPPPVRPAGRRNLRNIGSDT
jgi:hypothetical protein